MVRFLSFPYASVWAIRLTSPCFVYRYYTTRRKDLGVATLFLDQSSVVLHLTGLNFSIPLLTFVPLCGVTAWLASGVSDTVPCTRHIGRGTCERRRVCEKCETHAARPAFAKETPPVPKIL